MLARVEPQPQLRATQAGDKMTSEGWVFAPDWPSVEEIVGVADEAGVAVSDVMVGSYYYGDPNGFRFVIHKRPLKVSRWDRFRLKGRNRGRA